jgi:hypothetical protein
MGFTNAAAERPPITWIGAGGKFEVQAEGGEKLITKLTNIDLYARARTYFGSSDMNNYTIQADVMADEKLLGKRDEPAAERGLARSRRHRRRRTAAAERRRRRQGCTPDEEVGQAPAQADRRGSSRTSASSTAVRAGDDRHAPGVDALRLAGRAAPLDEQDDLVQSGSRRSGTR